MFEPWMGYLIFGAIGVFFALSGKEPLKGMFLVMPILLTAILTGFSLYAMSAADWSYQGLNHDAKMVLGMTTLCWCWAIAKFARYIYRQRTSAQPT